MQLLAQNRCPVPLFCCRAEFEREKDFMARNAADLKGIVRLNIGGERTVEVLRETADPHSMLAAMFSGRHQVCIRFPFALARACEQRVHYLLRFTGGPY